MYPTPEFTAYWYLRLNGFLTTANFIVHPERGANQLTDVDVVGVRFPYHSELDFQDDHWITTLPKVPLLVICEVKTSDCVFNRSLRQPHNTTVARTIRSVGIVPRTQESAAIDSIYEKGSYEASDYIVKILCFGTDYNPDISSAYPQAKQLAWLDVFAFLHHRFAENRSRKGHHDQWPNEAKVLWKAASFMPLHEFSTFVFELWKVTE